MKKEPIHVYCRLRPMVDPSEVSCMKVIGSNIIQMTTPSNMANTRVGCYKEIQYVFKRVFEEHISQKEVFDDVAFPLIEGLLQGRSSLLFAYGITGSGKTYTMSGTPQDGGIMPRTLDCIFNSISGFQAKKYVFKPDRLNGFEVQTEAEAKADCVSELHRNIQTLQK